MARKYEWTRKDGTVGKAWEATWYSPDGKPHTKAGFPRKLDAEQYEESQRVDIRRGEWTDPKRGEMSYEEWARKWWKGYSLELAESTRIEYERILERILIPEFGAWPLARIGQEDVQAWVNAGAQDVAPATVKKRYDLFQRSMAEAEVARRIPHTPCVSVRLPKSRRRSATALTPAQVNALVEACDPRYRAMLLVAAYGGLRLGELAGLHVDEVNLLRGEVRVVAVMEWQRGKPVPREVPKSDAGERAVSLPPPVVAALEAHLDEHGVTDEGYVFGSPEGDRLRKDNFRRRVWVPARKAAGLGNGVRFHDLRHTAASLMIAMGADILTVSRRLGHAKSSYTMDLYGHWYPDEDEALMERMGQAIETGGIHGERSNVVPIAR